MLLVRVTTAWVGPGAKIGLSFPSCYCCLSMAVKFLGHEV